jgi:phage terminase large subunit-like protein
MILTTLETRTEFLRAQLEELYGLHCIPKWGTPRDLTRKTYGPKAAKFAAAIGTPFMPWQRYVADVALEVDPYTGLLWYDQILLMVPRQSGKTTLELAIMAWRACAWPKQNILYAAQTRNAAREKWEDEHVPALQAAPSINKRIRKIVLRNGSEAIKFHNRSKWGITSNTETAGHGPTLDMGTIDEAFSQEDSRTENAMSPAMITRTQPQLYVVSTAGTEKSLYLNGKRGAAHAIVESGLSSKTACFDFTVEGGVYDRNDPRTWWSCMPALGHTVTVERIQSRLEQLVGEGKPEEFDRAYLNVTRDRKVKTDPNVPAEVWPALADEHSQPDDPVAFGVDISPDRHYAAVAMYGLRGDGLGHVELIAHREGTDWLVDFLLGLRERWNPVAFGIDARGPSVTLMLNLDKVGIKPPEDVNKPKQAELAVTSTLDMAAACGDLTDACRNDKLRHRDQPALNSALGNAISRPLGDAYAWGRKVSNGDISPLVAITLARWAYLARVDKIVKAAGPPNLY